MQTAAERQYLIRHQGDIDAFLADLSERDLLRDSVREEWRHAVRSAILLRNQLKGMGAYRADGVYKGTLINLEYAFKSFLRRAGHDGVDFDKSVSTGYRALIELQETVAQQVENLVRDDPALAATYMGLPAEIRGNSKRTRDFHGL
ncbi:hypothetical protein [Microbacterium sp.]|uniref:hypothetical protein n=1 Tax=Microbacterium sp. TaxID=51671 RepID=UPI003562C1CC